MPTSTVVKIGMVGAAIHTETFVPGSTVEQAIKQAGRAHTVSFGGESYLDFIDAAIDDVSKMRAFMGAMKANILDSNERSLGIAVVALMVNVGLNLWLIPLFSYPAAAFITFVTEGLIVVLSMKVIGKELEINLSPAKMVRTIEDLVSRKEKLF